MDVPTCNCDFLQNRYQFDLLYARDDIDMVSGIVKASSASNEAESSHLFKMIFQDPNVSMDPLQFLAVVMLNKILLSLSLSILFASPPLFTNKCCLLNPLVKRLSEVVSLIQDSYLISFVSFFGRSPYLITLFREKKWEEFVLNTLKNQSFPMDLSEESIANRMLTIKYFSLPSPSALEKIYRGLNRLEGSLPKFHSCLASLADIDTLECIAAIVMYIKYSDLFKKFFRPNTNGIEALNALLIQNFSEAKPASYVNSFLNCFNSYHLAQLIQEKQWVELTVHMLLLDKDCIKGHCSNLSHKRYFQSIIRADIEDMVCKKITNPYNNDLLPIWMDPLQFLGVLIGNKHVGRRCVDFSESFSISTIFPEKDDLLKFLADWLCRVGDSIRDSYLISFVSCFDRKATLVLLFREKKWEEFVLHTIHNYQAPYRLESYQAIDRQVNRYFSLPEVNILDSLRECFQTIFDPAFYLSLESFRLYLDEHKEMIPCFQPFNFLASLKYDQKLLDWFLDDSCMYKATRNKIIMAHLCSFINILVKQSCLPRAYMYSFLSCFNKLGIWDLFKEKEWEEFVLKFLESE